jgi:hypothetical protein
MVTGSESKRCGAGHRSMEIESLYKTTTVCNRKFVQNYYGLQQEFVIVSGPRQAGKKSGDFLFS